MMESTVALIIEGYTEVADGMERVGLESPSGVVVKAYRAGTIIRIDVKEDDS